MKNNFVHNYPQTSTKITLMNQNQAYSCFFVPETVSFYKLMTDDELDVWKHLSCIVEVDLENPEDLHNLHNDYPLPPERVKMGNVEN